MPVLAAQSGTWSLEFLVDFVFLKAHLVSAVRMYTVQIRANTCMHIAICQAPFQGQALFLSDVSDAVMASSIENSSYEETSKRVVDLLAQLARLGAKDVQNIEIPSIGEFVIFRRIPHHASKMGGSLALQLCAVISPLGSPVSFSASWALICHARREHAQGMRRKQSYDHVILRST